MVANTRVTLPQCRSLDYWHKEYTSSDGVTKYTVHLTHDERQFSCECKGFQYRGDCKHVKQAAQDYCGWCALWCDEPYEESSKKCPRCGDEVDFRNHMV
jgi:hypothetical protein